MTIRTITCSVLLTLPMLLGGCERVSSDDTSTSSSIAIDGSSTVATLTGAVSDDFREEHPDINPSMNISGTGGGFKRFVRGDTDISNASRPIKASELEIANSNSIEFIEIPVALDGITFAVHPDNDWVDHLTVEELRTIFGRDGGVTNWSDIRAGWPDKKINLFAPGRDSGTYDFFKEVAFSDDAPTRNDITLSESDNTLVRGIVDDVHAFGYFGFAYYLNNKDTLRAVPIINTKGQPISPSLKTIADGTYAPFSRPLYIYVNNARAKNKSVETFVDYYLENAGRLAPVAGYAPLTEEQYEMARSLWTDRTLGTVWLDDSGKHVHAPINEVYGR